MELGQKSGVCLVEVRERNVLRRAVRTGRDIEQSGGEVDARQLDQGTRGLVEVVREEVWLGVVAPGSRVVARVGKLIALQPEVLVVPTSAEC